MQKLLFSAVIVSLALVRLAPADDKDEAKGKDLKSQVHSGYFEKNDSGLKGEASYLAITDQKNFDQVFAMAVVMGTKPNFLPKKAFDSRMAAAVIKRGGAVWTYTVEKVTEDDGTLCVQYKAVSKDGGGARFASPLIVSVDKGKYKSVVFIENGKKIGAAEVGK